MNLTRERAESILIGHFVDLDKYPVCLIGIRGALSNKANKFNKYDDLLFWFSPNVFCRYEANTDPKIYGQAVLQEGFWMYKPGMHPYNPPNYEAFRQAGNVTVKRNEVIEYGYFGINIHKGGPRFMRDFKN